MTHRRASNPACVCVVVALVVSVQAFAAQSGPPALTVSGDVSTPLSLAPARSRSIRMLQRLEVVRLRK